MRDAFHRVSFSHVAACKSWCNTILQLSTFLIIVDVAISGIEPLTLALLAPRSNQLS